MSIGRLKHRVIIQELTDGTGVRGGLTKTWAQFAQRWGQVEPLTGRERFLSQQENAEGSTRIQVRHVPGLTPKMRLLVPRTATTLNGAINSSVTTAVITSATGFPKSGSYRIRIDSELMDVTAGQGTTSWTVTRSVDGSTAASHGDAAGVRHMAIHDIGSVVNVDERNRWNELLVTEAV